MLSYTPRFKVGQYVVRQTIDDGLFCIHRVETKYILFHFYYLEIVDVETFDHPEIPKLYSRPFVAKDLTLTDFDDMTPYLNKIILDYIGPKRIGRPWTHIENNILKRFFEDLTKIELETMFNRSYNSIRTQYKKVSKNV